MIRGMKAAILAVGSELLGPDRLDTNSLRLTTIFERYGVELIGKSVVGDDEAAIAGELRHWMRGADLVVVSGGLGPTADDVTRRAAAAALARRIEISEVLVEQLRRRFASFGRDMPEVNRRQAEVIEGAELLENRVGTAPGVRLEEEQATIFLFPGVPGELEKMIELHLEPWLAERTQIEGAPAEGLERWVIKVACLPESEVEQRIQPLYERHGRLAITVLASPGEVQLHLTARGPEQARRFTLKAMREQAVRLVGEAVFAENAETTLESAVGELLAATGKRLATAESCTGGLLAERITRVAGSSGWFLGGVVSYSNQLKERLLGVPAELLAAHGAVSRPVALAMAEGARASCGSDWALAITGIAGPEGGSEEKPVGTVHLALAGPGGELDHELRRFPGDRAAVRWQASQLALEMLRQRLRPRRLAAVPPAPDLQDD